MNKEYITIPSNMDIFVHTEHNTPFHPRGTPFSSVDNAILSEQSNAKHLIKGGSLMEDMIISLQSFYGLNSESESKDKNIILSEVRDLKNIASFSYSGIILEEPTQNRRKPLFFSMKNIQNFINKGNVRNIEGNQRKIFEIDTNVYGLWDEINNSTFIDIINTYPSTPMINFVKIRFPEFGSLPKKLSENSIQKIINISFIHHNTNILSKEEAIHGFDPIERGRFRLGFLLRKIENYIYSKPSFQNYRVLIHLFVCRNYYNEPDKSIKRIKSLNQLYQNTFGNFLVQVNEKMKSSKDIHIKKTFSLLLRSYHTKYYFIEDEYQFLWNLLHDFDKALIQSQDMIFQRNIRYYIYMYKQEDGKVLRIRYDIQKYFDFEIEEDVEKIMKIISFFMKNSTKDDEKKYVLLSVIYYYDNYYKRVNKKDLLHLLYIHMWNEYRSILDTIQAPP